MKKCYFYYNNCYIFNNINYFYDYYYEIKMRLENKIFNNYIDWSVLGGVINI